MATTNDFKGLNQRNTGGKHGCKLTAENRDVARRDLAFTLKQAGALLLDATGYHALAAQIGTHASFVSCHALALDLVALAISTFPKER